MDTCKYTGYTPIHPLHTDSSAWGFGMNAQVIAPHGQCAWGFGMHAQVIAPHGQCVCVGLRDARPGHCTPRPICPRPE